VRDIEEDWTRLQALPDEALLALEAHALDVRARASAAIRDVDGDNRPALVAMFGALDLRCGLLSAEVSRRCAAEVDLLC
jgi:hypothetical protein